jgi:cell division protein FtsZ
LFNVTGGADLGMHEIDEAAKVITNAVDTEANIIFGAVIDPNITGEVRITVIATGFEGVHNPMQAHNHLEFETRKSVPSLEPEKDEVEEEDEDEWAIPTFIRKRME